MTTQVITSNDIDLQTLKIEGNKLTVNLENVVPAAKADRFLKNVTASGDNTKIIFTVSPETEGDVDTTFELPVASFLTGLATTEALEAEKARIGVVEGKVSTLEAKPEPEAYELTADKLSPLLADPAVRASLIEAIKGEEVAGLDGVAKGFLIANA